jgi:hypothetical protein
VSSLFLTGVTRVAASCLDAQTTVIGPQFAKRRHAAFACGQDLHLPCRSDHKRAAEMRVLREIRQITSNLATGEQRDCVHIVPLGILLCPAHRLVTGLAHPPSIALEDRDLTAIGNVPQLSRGPRRFLLTIASKFKARRRR